MELLAKYNALPILVPRIAQVLPLLDSLFPIHGLLLTEGEDIGPTVTKALKDTSEHAVDPDLLLEQHPSDATPDENKDAIEVHLIRRCLRDGIPILAICRGSQLMNVLNGGELFCDVALQHQSKLPTKVHTSHINYQDYDNHRHGIDIIPGTPLSTWFNGQLHVDVNSYHHQGYSKLAERFKPMAYAPDGLIEAYYDPKMYDPSEGKYIVGLQFHPERMQSIDAHLKGLGPLFEDDGHMRPYEDLVVAAMAFQRKRMACIREARQKRSGRRHNHVFSSDEAVSESDVMKRLLRAGASVHGVHIIRDLLQLEEKENDGESSNGLFAKTGIVRGNSLLQLRI